MAAPGTYREFARLTVIKESEGAPNASEMIRELVAGQEAVVKGKDHAVTGAHTG